jgi:hypothetical protein
MREKGDRYRPIVTILKQKNGTPTKVLISGEEYALVPKDYINGYKSQVKKK